MKSSARVLGIDDGYFRPRHKGETFLVGVVYRLGYGVEGILSCKVKVDGLESTSAIAGMLRRSKFFPQVSCILLEGVNFAGFNIVDLPKLCKSTGKPVIAVLRKKPRMRKIEAALLKFRDRKKRMRLIEKAGEIHPFKSIFYQSCGISSEDVRLVLGRSCVHSNLPEPVRLAHLIASGITIGESTRP